MKFIGALKSSITLSMVTLVVIATILIWSFFNIRVWEKRDDKRQVITQDVVNYYCYLPAAFIHGDLTFRFVESDWSGYARHGKFWPVKVDGSDKYVVKMTMGMSYLYLPFFGIAHLYSSISDEYAADGFSTPYEVLIVISSIFWIIIGFVYLRLVLLKYYSEVIASIVMFLVLVGTNLYYYGTTEPAMSHGYIFSLVAMFLYYSIRWLECKQLRYIIMIGLLGGVITLIRPVNILIFIFPLLYGVNSLTEMKLRLSLIKAKWMHICLLMFFSFIVILPQLIFWKYNSGSWVYYSYGDEQFFFSNPHVFYGLFSYRKGWLLYTPIMIFALVGLVNSWKQKRPFTASILVFLPLFLYVVFSWWCWWYGGSYGSRPMIDMYALFALPLGAFLTWVAKLKFYWSSPIVALILFFVFLNLFQTAQKREGYIHYDAMTEKAYWSNFLSLDDAGGFWDNIVNPDLEKAMRGEEEYRKLSTQVAHWKFRGLLK
jgi:hypothetical protein